MVFNASKEKERAAKLKPAPQKDTFFEKVKNFYGHCERKPATRIVMLTVH
jgi:hypothetical protein